jgi:hypothetical protein
MLEISLIACMLTVVYFKSPMVKPAPHEFRQEANAYESKSESDDIPREHTRDLRGVLERNTIRLKLVDNN